MRRLPAMIRSLSRTFLRMEVMLLLLLLAMTILGRTTDLDARIKLSLSDTVKDYYAEGVITALDDRPASPDRDRRATAILPVSR